MRQKKVWRYWCDHCNKGGCGKHQMQTHEKHCTMNPDRYCRLCKSDNTQLLRAIGVLPNPKDYGVENKDYLYAWTSYPKMHEVLEQVMPDVRAILDNCPVCMLAALRQRGQGELYSSTFDYQKEMKEHWDEVNDYAEECRSY